MVVSLDEKLSGERIGLSPQHLLNRYSKKGFHELKQALSCRASLSLVVSWKRWRAPVQSYSLDFAGQILPEKLLEGLNRKSDDPSGWRVAKT
jgi:hypothetical protein